jgi:hypothetical protein
MKIGFGLPTHIAGVPGPLIADWRGARSNEGLNR